jgi:hypothetical protein
LGENWAENQLYGSHPCENRLGELELEFFLKEKRKPRSSSQGLGGKMGRFMVRSFRV